MEIKWTTRTTFWKCMISIKRSTYRIIKSAPKYYLGFIVLILVFISVSMSQWKWRSVRNEYVNFVPRKYEQKKKLELGCQLPDIKPFSKTAMRYNQDMPKVVCHGEDWVECNMSECRVTQHILDTTSDIVCHYKDIIYISDQMYVVADPVTLHGDAVYKLNSSDGIKVSCTGYDKVWLSILTKRWFGYKAGIRPLERTAPESNNTINILIVGFDSTSRNGFIRKMPKSYKYLEEEMEAVILKGYNIVGDGTAKALFPILSGRTELQHPYSGKQYSKHILLNPDLFIFHTVKLNGYETAYLEDMPWIGSFQLHYNGFSGRPADHYLRSFLMDQTKHRNESNGINSGYCLGSTPQYLYLLNLARQFMNLKTKRFCFTFIADISHDDFNMISTADEDMVQFLEYVKLNLLEDTMVIVMGDHGSRYSPMRGTYQGKMEERLALMSIILPERLKRQRQEALYFLKINADLLTTPFDIHTTLLDAMGLQKYASDFMVPNAKIKRGLSLIKSIPVWRSCASAGVLPHWCTCVNARWENVHRLSPTYGGTVKALVNFINNITAEKRELCAERKLTSIEWVVSQKNKDLSQNDIIYYQTLIIMSPGRAAFEGSMQYDAKKDLFIISEKDISRISAYGNEPACVSDTHPHLNKYCYCKVYMEFFNLNKKINK